MSGPVLGERYRLECCIAVGAMGEVWRGQDLLLRRPVAVKLMRVDCAQDPEASARFGAEARYAARLCHPGIAKVYDYCADGRPFLVMELVRGHSLAVRLNAGRLEAWRVLDVVAQVARALQASHDAGVLHRDIKPANLLLDGNGTVKITDFGIAETPETSALTSTGIVVGTPAYLAPERIAGQPASAASDLYSLGIVMYECLTGTRPFTGSMLDVAMAHQLRDLPPLPPSTDPAVVSLLADLTAKDPFARPVSAASVAIRAALLRDELPVPAEPDRTLASAARRAGQRSAVSSLPECEQTQPEITGLARVRPAHPARLRAFRMKVAAVVVAACMAGVALTSLAESHAKAPSPAGSVTSELRQAKGP
jgi:serine/threonine protein kinase